VSTATQDDDVEPVRAIERADLHGGGWIVSTVFVRPVTVTIFGSA
jgi:hypothetical protein